MRLLFWFFPAVVIPLMCLQLSSRQTSSPATINTQEQPLPLLTRQQQITLVAPTVSASRPPTLLIPSCVLNGNSQMRKKGH